MEGKKFTDVPVKVNNIEVNNLETLLEALKAGHDVPCHNSFLVLHEQEFMDEQTYRSLQFGKNGYVANLIEGSL